MATAPAPAATVASPMAAMVLLPTVVISANPTVAIRADLTLLAPAMVDMVAMIVVMVDHPMVDTAPLAMATAPTDIRPPDRATALSTPMVDMVDVVSPLATIATVTIKPSSSARVLR